jgi:hypothetical protein
MYIWQTLDSSTAMVARCDAGTVFTRSNTGIVASYPTQGADVSMRVFCVYVVLRVDSGLVLG